MTVALKLLTPTSAAVNTRLVLALSVNTKASNTQSVLSQLLMFANHVSANQMELSLVPTNEKNAPLNQLVKN
jgi:hypothetical protein